MDCCQKGLYLINLDFNWRIVESIYIKKGKDQNIYVLLQGKINLGINCVCIEQQCFFLCLGIYWAYLKHSVSISWPYLVHIMVNFYHILGIYIYLSGIYWESFRHIFGTYWAYLEHIQGILGGISWPYFGHMSDISWSFLGLISLSALDGMLQLCRHHFFPGLSQIIHDRSCE